MQLSLADGTSPAHLDGTTTGIVVMAVVMLIALGLFIGLVYWSAREPRVSPARQQPASGRGLSGAAERPVTSTASQGASYLLVDHAEHEEVPRP